MSDVAARVKKIVVEHLGVEADKVTDNASFIDDLGADSLDTVELGDGVRGRSSAARFPMTPPSRSRPSATPSSFSRRTPAARPEIRPLRAPQGRLQRRLCATTRRQPYTLGSGMLRRVVITGLGLVTPLGSGVDASWSRLIAGGNGRAPHRGVPG
jgi:hypothetical protein